MCFNTHVDMLYLINIRVVLGRTIFMREQPKVRILEFCPLQPIAPFPPKSWYLRITELSNYKSKSNCAMSAFKMKEKRQDHVSQMGTCQTLFKFNLNEWKAINRGLQPLPPSPLLIYVYCTSCDSHQTNLAVPLFNQG
jgi:hypothetical protein